MPPDIKDNFFYKPLYDTSKTSAEKESWLADTFNTAAADKLNPLLAEYNAFRNHLAKQRDHLNDQLDTAQRGNFRIEEALSDPAPDTALAEELARGQQNLLSRIEKSRLVAGEALTVMVNAEDKIKHYSRTVTETFGIFIEVMAQGRTVKSLEDALVNTRNELGMPAPLPAAPVKPFKPSQFAQLDTSVEAPSRAKFKKRGGP